MIVGTELPVDHAPIRIIRAQLWQRLIEFRDGLTAVDVSDRSFSAWLLEKGADPTTDKIPIVIDDGDSNLGDLVLSLASSTTDDLTSGRQYSWTFCEVIGSDFVSLWRGPVVVGDPNE